MRCKVRVQAVTDWGSSKTILMAAVTDNGIPENARFWQATPSGKIELQVRVLRGVHLW